MKCPPSRSLHILRNVSPSIACSHAQCKPSAAVSLPETNATTGPHRRRMLRRSYSASQRDAVGVEAADPSASTANQRVVGRQGGACPQHLRRGHHDTVVPRPHHHQRYRRLPLHLGSSRGGDRLSSTEAAAPSNAARPGRRATGQWGRTSPHSPPPLWLCCVCSEARFKLGKAPGLSVGLRAFAFANFSRWP